MQICQTGSEVIKVDRCKDMTVSLAYLSL